MDGKGICTKVCCAMSEKVQAEDGRVEVCFFAVLPVGQSVVGSCVEV